MVWSFVLAGLIIFAGVTNTSVLVSGTTNSFGKWVSAGKYATYQCAGGCGFAYLNSSGLTVYTMQHGTTILTWRVVSSNDTTAAITVNLSAEGEATSTCPDCPRVIPFSRNETFWITVELASNTMAFNNTSLGKNPFWLSERVSPGDTADAGFAVTNNGSKVQLSANVTNTSSQRWPTMLTLQTFKLNPYIAVFDSYDPNAGYALELWMPGVPALPGDLLQTGSYKVNNQTITSIAGLPLAILLHLNFSIRNIFLLTGTNISSQPPQTGGIPGTELAILLATATAALAISAIFLWRWSSKKG